MKSAYLTLILTLHPYLTGQLYLSDQKHFLPRVSDQKHFLPRVYDFLGLSDTASSVTLGLQTLIKEPCLLTY